MLDDSFHVYDTTLRDGAQGEGMSFSVSDKLAVARLAPQVWFPSASRRRDLDSRPTSAHSPASRVVRRAVTWTDS